MQHKCGLDTEQCSLRSRKDQGSEKVGANNICVVHTTCGQSPPMKCLTISLRHVTPSSLTDILKLQENISLCAQANPHARPCQWAQPCTFLFAPCVINLCMSTIFVSVTRDVYHLHGKQLATCRYTSSTVLKNMPPSEADASSKRHTAKSGVVWYTTTNLVQVYTSVCIARCLETHQSRKFNCDDVITAPLIVCGCKQRAGNL